jgi:hypothetical protein
VTDLMRDREVAELRARVEKAESLLAEAREACVLKSQQAWLRSGRVI